MPFIESKIRREEMDQIVHLMEELKVKADGDLHYVLFKYFKYNVEQRYNPMKNFIGELSEAASYLREEFLWPYENKAKNKNGDV